MKWARRNEEEQHELVVRSEGPLGEQTDPLIGPPRRHVRRPRRKTQKLNELLYIATLINPVDHRFYTVIWEHGHLRIITPTSEDEIEIWGTGSLEEDDYPAPETNCPRTHTPGGVVTKGYGLGLMLYSGLALAAAMGSAMSQREARRHGLPPNREPCISSSDEGPGRSTEADKWWSKQVELGFAREVEISGECEDEDFYASIDAEDAGYDEDRVLQEAGDREGEIRGISGELSGRISYTFCPRDIAAQVLEAEKVFEKGLVFHWNDTLHEEAKGSTSRWPLPKEVLLEIDLEGVNEPHLVEALLLELEATGASAKEIQAFLKRNGLDPQSLRLPGVELGEPEPYHRMQKNPRKHSAAWRKAFGELVNDAASPAVENRRRR